MLEVWFRASPRNLENCTQQNGLKAVSAEVWKTMLDLVNCKVLSIVESDDVDSYLLSESSMFVFPHKLILKTCGTTTLLCGLPRILEIAALYGGFDTPLEAAPNVAVAAAPYRVFYSRKNFLFPDRQRGPHRSWRDEVKSLDKLFLGGSAYMIGKMNGEHWYLYLTEPNTLLTPPASPAETETTETETKVLALPTTNHTTVCDEEDETLEVLMTDLDEDNARQFYLEHATAVAESQYRSKASLSTSASSDSLVDVFDNPPTPPDVPAELTTEGHALGTVVSDACGLSNIYPKTDYPGSRIDAYLFTPCGFSANGVIPVPSTHPGGGGTHYFNVHVTPEKHCSYASFETNVPSVSASLDSACETTQIIRRVVDIFRPGRFSVTLFEAKTSMADEADKDEGLRAQERKARKRHVSMENILGYRRVDRIVHDLDGYDLVFRYYERLDWKGGAPRIGEWGS